MSLKPSKVELEWLHERPYRESPLLRAVELSEGRRLGVKLLRISSGQEHVADTELVALRAARERYLASIAESISRTKGRFSKGHQRNGKFYRMRREHALHIVPRPRCRLCEEAKA